MLQLIYTSEAASTIDTVYLSDICEQASTNNMRDEVTGILLVHGQYFLQVIEGPMHTVENTFLRIMNDDRHHSVLVLHRQTETRREFGDFAMAPCMNTQEKHAAIEKIRAYLANRPAALQSEFDARFPLNGIETVLALPSG